MTLFNSIFGLLPKEVFLLVLFADVVMSFVIKLAVVLAISNVNLRRMSDAKFVGGGHDVDMRRNWRESPRHK